RQTSRDHDGVDTTFDDLVALQVAGIKTPVHWVGIGDLADAASLKAMADATGARYVSVENMAGLKGALTSTAARLRSQVPICFDLSVCGHVGIRLTVEFDFEGRRETLALPHWFEADCDCRGKSVRCTLG
ncbi:hypothetical protein ACFL5O_12290, partial [Myxococcota bacterium]